ncbi:MAG TPA: flagellar biosynthesis protein FlhB [Sphingomonadaceae bacterium]|jgi:flagellar biosynthetic protein FlhB|nr:flagellar biosynthesis protein FlhB [Sphingomonadaceae bacterium]
MADTDKDQKTEQPTGRRLEKAREKGEVPISPEMRHATMFIAAIIVTGGMGAWTLSRLGAMLVRLWGQADDFTLDPNGAQNLVVGVACQFALAMAPLAALLMGCALLTLFLQGPPTLAWARLAPKWSKLSPISGFTRLLSANALVEFGKTLAKFAVIVTVAILILWPKAVALDQLIGAGADAIARTAAALVYRLVKAVGILVFLLAAADFVYQRRSFLKRMRMTRQEVKDEHKESDGDPKIKGRIRSIRLQRARKRMMAAVPTASVVITNPTHYAVALKYDHGQMAAPMVVAKGADLVALKIREIAAGAGVPVVESPPLARALYASVEIDRPIPIEHYTAVAEVISYVMRLARRRA